MAFTDESDAGVPIDTGMGATPRLVAAEPRGAGHE